MEDQPVIESTAPKKNLVPFIVAGVVLLCCCLVVAGAVGMLIYSSTPGGTSALPSSYDGIADAELRTDTMNLIGAQESSSGCDDVALVTAEVVNPPQADLGGVWTEMWQISSCGESHLYAVTFSPDPAGGTNIYALRADQ